jgi:hypothetical protein
LFASVVLLAIVTAVVFARAHPLTPLIAVLASVATLVVGLMALALTRVVAALRDAFTQIRTLEAQNAALAERLSAIPNVENLRARLALAERRLTALAIKLEVTDELGQIDGR